MMAHLFALVAIIVAREPDFITVEIKFAWQAILHEDCCPASVVIQQGFW
jgi:hypothetical protein